MPNWLDPNTDLEDSIIQLQNVFDALEARENSRHTATVDEVQDLTNRIRRAFRNLRRGRSVQEELPSNQLKALDRITKEYGQWQRNQNSLLLRSKTRSKCSGLS